MMSTVDQTIAARSRADSTFRNGLLADACTAFTRNDLAVTKTLIRHYIDASVGFQQLAEEMSKSPKSLMRMFSTAGNLTSEHLSEVFGLLQAHSGITLSVSTEKTSGLQTA